MGPEGAFLRFVEPLRNQAPLKRRLQLEHLRGDDRQGKEAWAAPLRPADRVAQLELHAGPCRRLEHLAQLPDLLLGPVAEKGEGHVQGLRRHRPQRRVAQLAVSPTLQRRPHRLG